ncbi:LysM peptidoglycan-binding domain-containing protein [Arthrobacter sp. B0490]|uniref:LysM peptidoglycan-binding domain-containing protein n=1 Tax=Arthrobacter sp. B0490 TaxID=2058891 RepID=UPI000CE4E33D|nr:LysM peptidoglycan-binding domain-containing protein [Arthrobacter sp. B0490]
MTAQRSNAPLNGTRRKAAGASRRGLNVAVTTAALPAVLLSSVAFAPQAAATPTLQAPAVRHLTGPSTQIPARAVIPAALVAGSVPAQKVTVPTVTTPSDYTIKPGDTVGAIAKRFGLSTDAVLKLNRMDARTVIYPGQKIKLTGAAPAGKPAPAAQPSAATYVVKPGDTLGAIASRNGVSLQALLTANKLSMTSVIHPGQKISLGGGTATPTPVKPAPAPSPAPAPAGATYTVKSGDTLGAIASRNGIGLDVLLKANNLGLTSVIHPGQKLKLTGSVTPQATPPKAPTPAPAPAAGSYTVKAGDTLGAIASRNGIALSGLLAANRMTMTSVIYPGQKLTLPGAGTTPAPAPAPTPAPGNLVPSTFLGYQYPDKVVADANANKALLNSMPAPSQAEMKQIVADTARSMGVDPSLALAFAHQESGFNQRAVSPANAIGTMQVIPSSGQWASDLVGRKLNLLDPYDNATAGVAIIRSLVRTSSSLDIAIASYYQGQYSVQTRGMFEDTKQYVASIKAHQKNFK